MWKHHTKIQLKAGLLHNKVLKLTTDKVQECTNKGYTVLFKLVVSVAIYYQGKGIEPSIKIEGIWQIYGSQNQT